MKKRTIYLSIITFFSISIAFAQGGQTGSLTWNINNDILTISGSDTMPDYYYPEQAPWQDYQEFINTVVIETGVKSIGSFAFEGCIFMKLITIPNSVTRIGDNAFFSCSGLSTITIPNSVTHIGKYAFSGCYCLTSITIPNSLTSISDFTFYACINLTSVIIPGSITSIGNSAFDFCSKLTEIIIPNSVKSIGNSAFSQCPKLQSIIIPNSVISIGNWIFANCTNLLEVVLSDSIISIEESSFAFCINLPSINIPKSVTSIGENAFSGCVSLSLITNLNPEPVEINPNVFSYIDKSACTLRVLISSASIYKNTEVWKEFNIIGICSINVSVNNKEYGTVTGSGCYDENNTAIVTAIEYTGYKFKDWTKNGATVSNENPYSFIVTENVELVANFEEKAEIENFEFTTCKIFPNPTTGELTISPAGGGKGVEQLTINNVEIIDIYGKCHLSLVTRHKNNIDISHLQAGIYFLKIITEKGVIVRKIIKK